MPVDERSVLIDQADQQSWVQLGPISINLQTKSVIVEGRALQLSPREYSLMELFALRGGGLVSRAEMYDRLSDQFDRTLPNLLDVHIHNLRRKLGRGVIVTRRGRGYALCE